MVSIQDFVEEHPEYPFDHLKVEITIIFAYEPRYVTIDRFTNQIYVLLIDKFVLFGEQSELDMLIYSQSGEFLRCFSPSNIQYFRGMAIHKNNMYILSGESHFYHFKVADSINLIGSKNAKGSGIGEFIEPRQLDISEEGDLFVADFGDNRVQILDCSLQYKRHISHHSMLKPCDVKLTPDEVYVLGDGPWKSTNCIHIFTYMGEKLRSIFLNVFPKRMQCRQFCVDTCGNVIVIDDATQQIRFFTKGGDLFETMDTFGGIPDQLIGVAWMNKHKLVAVSSKSVWTRLEIYSYF